MNLDKVTVIIPYREDRGFLKQAIESVKKQTYPNIELIIAHGDKSVSENINDGIRRSTGVFIKYLCEDDTLTPNSIADSVAGMQGVDFIHGNAYNVHNNSKSEQRPFRKIPTLKEMLFNNIIHGGTLMYRRDVFDRVGFFDESLDCAEEYDFNLKCLYNGLKVGYVNSFLYNYRRHDKQKSLGKGIDQRERRLKIEAIKQRYKAKKTVVGIATFKGREQTIKNTIRSLESQVDVIRVYDNEKRDINLTDNGKFYFLQEYEEPIIYFSCDDDIIYPPTYVRDMIEAIEKHKCIVTHHGRMLRGVGRRYYFEHKTFQCLKENRAERVIHVAGTGVTAFDTSYFNPVDIWKSDDKRMSDLVFSVEARRQGKKIVVLPHGKYYFEYQHIPLNETIHGVDSRNDSRQSELADLILTL